MKFHCSVITPFSIYLCSGANPFYLKGRIQQREIIKLLYILNILLWTGFATANDTEPNIMVLSDELKIQALSPDVYLVIHAFPWPGNSLLVKTDSTNLLWVDTPYTPDATKQVLRWLDKKFGTSVKIIQINTGFHIDNLGGNAALKARNIPIYGSDTTCALLKSTAEATMRKLRVWLSGPENKKYLEVYKTFKFVAPTRVFPIQKPKVLIMGGEKVEIFFPGPSHTFDNLVVYVPSKKILFGGCMVLENAAQKLGFIDDGDVTQWSASLRKVKARYQNTELIVPGHGKLGGRALLDHTITVVDKHNGTVTQQN